MRSIAPSPEHSASLARFIFTLSRNPKHAGVSTMHTGNVNVDKDFFLLCRLAGQLLQDKRQKTEINNIRRGLGTEGRGGRVDLTGLGFVLLCLHHRKAVWARMCQNWQSKCSPLLSSCFFQVEILTSIIFEDTISWNRTVRSAGRTVSVEGCWWGRIRYEVNATGLFWEMFSFIGQSLFCNVIFQVHDHVWQPVESRVIFWENNTFRTKK